MRPASHLHHPLLPQLLPPTSSLPPLRTLDRAAEDRLFEALDNLYKLYCAPLPLPPPPAHHNSGVPTPLDVQSCLCRKKSSTSSSGRGADTCTGTCTPALVDSGYISENEEVSGDTNDDDNDDEEDGKAALRADPFERGFAERWLTGFLARAEEEGEVEDGSEEDSTTPPSFFSSADARDRAVELVSSVLSSLFAGTAGDEEEEEESDRIAREFRFRLTVPGTETITEEEKDEITVRLNDGLAGTRNDDHTDVGLQSWAGAIVFSEMLCAAPAKFGLVPARRHGPHIVELGAGTGLVSLVLAKALPQLGVSNRAAIVATDYHPAVMENLRANIAMNFPSADTENSPLEETEEASVPVPISVKARQLDWADPSALDGPPLAPGSADILVATDVVYAPEHAAWLRGCASRLLKRKSDNNDGGVFWLVATVRPTGKFEGISDTVRAVFGGAGASESGQERTPGGEVDVDADGRTLTILDEEWIDKRPGLGRGDESGYRLFRIGWA